MAHADDSDTDTGKRARDGSRRGGRREGAGRRVGSRGKKTLKREAKLKAAVKRGLEPFEFLLAEMRDLSLPRRDRQQIAVWLLPYSTPRRGLTAQVKSFYEMTEEELDWQIADYRNGPSPGKWRPRIVKGGR